MTVAAAEQVTDAVIATLEGDGHPVGDHDAPADTTGRYTIVTHIRGGGFEGSQAFDHEMATLGFQVESYGRSRRQCQHLADVNRLLLVTPGDVVPVGWKVMYAWSTGAGGVDNDGTGIDGPLFCSIETFYLQVCRLPAP